MTALFEYNGYRYRLGQSNLFSPYELAEMAAADREIESAFAAPAAAPDSAKRQKDRERALRYYYRHRAAIRDRVRDYQAQYRASHREERREYNRQYRAAKKNRPADADAPNGALNIDHIHYTASALSAQGG